MPLPSGIPIPTPAPFQIPVAPSQDSQHPLLPPPKILVGLPAPRVPGLPSPASGPQRADTHSDSRVGERISGRSTEPSHRALSLEQEQLRGHFPFGGLQASPTPSPASSSSSRTPAPPMPPDPRRGSSFSLPSQLGPGLGHYISHARRPSMPPAGTPCPGFSLLSVSLQPVFLPLCLRCLNFCLCLFPCFCVSLLFCISDSVSLVPTLSLSLYLSCLSLSLFLCLCLSVGLSFCVCVRVCLSDVFISVPLPPHPPPNPSSSLEVSSPPPTSLLPGGLGKGLSGHRALKAKQGKEAGVRGHRKSSPWGRGQRAPREGRGHWGLSCPGSSQPAPSPDTQLHSTHGG